MLTIKGDKTIEQLLKENKDYLYHYWFGGNVAEFESDKLPGYTFYLGAYGDVRARLVEKSTGNTLEYVKDKRNGAGFYHIMKRYFNDAGLKLLLEEKHPEYELSIQDNNWWECYAINNSTNRIVELGDILNADLLSEAVEEIKDLEEDYIAWIIEEDEEAHSYIAFGGEEVNGELYYYVQIQKGNTSEFVADHIDTRSKAMFIAAQKAVELQLEVKEW